MDPYNSPHLALLKSSATAAIAKREGGKVSEEHPMLKAIDTYSEAMLKNIPLVAPKDSENEHSDTDPTIMAYLVQLHHQLAHAEIAKDEQRVTEINKQRARFKFGNPLWEEMFVEYFLYYWDYPFHKGQSPQYRSWQDELYGNNNLDYGTIKWKIPTDATVAIIGDIGIGTDIAAAVLEATLSFDPDVILHLGDIYYSGTPYEFDTRFTGLINEVMKANNKQVPVFNIPGNHEYFTGGVAFYDCLDGMQLVYSADQRQQASFFGLQTEDDSWQFLGMDTSFYGHYMDVPEKIQKATLSLLHNNKVDLPEDKSNPHWANAYNPLFHRCNDATIAVKDTTVKEEMIPIRTDEQEWHANQIKNFTGRTILLSHHQVYSAKQKIGVPQQKIEEDGVLVPDETDTNRAWINTKLYQQFGEFMDTKVAAWFWGHEHNLGIYKDEYRPEGWPTSAELLKTIPKGRCTGHSAIPVAEKEAPYEQKYPVPLVNESVKLGITDGWYNRGFQILKLNGSVKPITASYYQLQEAAIKPLLIYTEEII